MADKEEYKTIGVRLPTSLIDALTDNYGESQVGMRERDEWIADTLQAEVDILTSDEPIEGEIDVGDGIKLFKR